MSNRLGKLKHQLDSIEPYLFVLLILAHLIPICASTYFVTVDGPAHLYNAQLIRSLFGGDGSIINQYLEFNPRLVPNWSGHFLLVCLLKFFSAAASEKIILGLYLIGLPLSFRYLARVMKARNMVLTFFIFPFTYSFLFYYGFYNFHLGLILYFLLFGLWIKSFEQGFSALRISLLIVLSIALYFSHLFMLAFFLLSIGVINAVALIRKGGNEPPHQKPSKIIVTQILVLLPVLLALAYFFVSKPFALGADIVSKDFAEKMQMLFHISPAKGIGYAKENKLTLWVFILLAVLLIFRLAKDWKSRKQSSITGALYTGALCILSLLAFLLLPNAGGGFGFVTPRFCLLFFLFLILFLSMRPLKTWLAIPVLLAISILSLAFLRIYNKTTTQNQIVTQGIVDASAHIYPGDKILPLLNHEYWLYGHVSNYIGAEVPVIIYENYEAELGYFPLVWKEEVKDEVSLAKAIMNSTHSFNLQDLTALAPDKILYILDSANPEKGNQALMHLESLSAGYEQIFKDSTASVALYGRR